MNFMVHSGSEGLGFRRTASLSPRRSLQCEPPDSPSGRTSLKRSAGPERTHLSMQSVQAPNRGDQCLQMQCFPTWCWTSGDILETVFRFTFRLFTSLVDFNASLASVGGKWRCTDVELAFFLMYFSSQAGSQSSPAAFSFWPSLSDLSSPV